MYTFNIKVRRDGAINLRKKNNSRIGIKPGSVVTVTVNNINGTVTLKPDGYICSICEKSFSTHLDAFGVCKACSAALVNAIRSESCSSFPDAYAKVKSERGVKVVSKR